MGSYLTESEHNELRRLHNYHSPLRASNTADREFSHHPASIRPSIKPARRAPIRFPFEFAASTLVPRICLLFANSSGKRISFESFKNWCMADAQFCFRITSFVKRLRQLLSFNEQFCSSTSISAVVLFRSGQLLALGYDQTRVSLDGSTER